MSKAIQYINGDKIGALVYIKEAEKGKGRRRAEFFCHCGESFITYISHAKIGDVTECPACALKRKKSVVTSRNTTHGLKRHHMYNMYNTMKQRCYNPNSTSYPHYGAKGVTVCQRWLDSFENFLTDMGERPSPKHSLERKRIKEGYTPENTIWLLRNLQSRNTSRTVFIEYKGQRRTLLEWSELLGVKRNVLYNRIFTYKIPLEQAMTNKKLPNRKIPHINNSFIPYAFGYLI